ncbi:hypothetical protein [Sulfurimonas sp.]
MLNILQELQENRHSYYNLLLENISDYTYREGRYAIRFSIALIFSPDNFFNDIDTLHESFRETDKVISINEHLLYAVFDAVDEKSYLKASENLCKTLQKTHFKEKFYTATAYSEEFNANYLDMTNKLFERLEYALKNNLHNSVVYQDYII